MEGILLGISSVERCMQAQESSRQSKKSQNN